MQSILEFEIFQKQFLAAIEELNFLRAQDAEHEAKLHQLIKEKHNLLIEMATLRKKVEESEENFHVNLAEAKQKFVNNLQQNDEEKTKNRILIDALTNENKLMKQEISKLNSEKLSWEKKINELEGKLAFQETLQRNVLNQALSAKELTAVLNEKCLKVTEAQNHLEQHVQEALMITKNRLNEYKLQREIFENEKLENEKLKNEIVQLRSLATSNKNKTVCTPEEVQEYKRAISKLRTDLEYQIIETTAWKAQSEEWEAQLKELTISLKNSHQLLSNRVENENQLQKQLKDWREKYERIQTELEKSEKKAEILHEKLKQVGQFDKETECAENTLEKLEELIAVNDEEEPITRRKSQ